MKKQETVTATTLPISECQGILVYLQHDVEGNIHPVSFEMLGEAGRLAKDAGYAVYAVSVGCGNTSKLEALAGCGVKAVYVADHEDLRYFRQDIYADAVIACVEACKPSVFLLGGTPEGRSLAPRVAVHFGTGLTADCTSLALNENAELLQTRPAFGGDLMAQIMTPNNRPQMATVRQGIMEPVQPQGSDIPEFISLDLAQLQLASCLKVLQATPAAPSQDISSAKVIVAIGRGVNSKDDIPLFQELADVLGGQLASGRSLVEKGWMPADRQVGLSGKTIRPDVLITCGISGSVQFMAGISGAKHIYAINHDPDARILGVAHTPVVADIYDVVPKLTALLKKV